MPNLILYGTPQSTYVRTARLLLAGAGADYQLKDIGLFNGDTQTDEYLQKHPFGKVPALEVEGDILYETDAITYYINKAYASDKFSPVDVLAQAHMHQIMAIVNHYLYAPAIGVLTIQNLIVPSQGGQPDQAAVEGAIAPAKKSIEAIEKLFEGDPYILGNDLSLADFYLIPIFVYISKTPQFEAITANTPKLKAWWEKVQNLDMVKEICS
jgi:glutathione S-transferase